MNLPTDEYATKNYWDERYTDEVDYDWFAQYKSFAHHIGRTINRSDRILQLGMPVPPYLHLNTKSLYVNSTCVR